LTKGGKEGMGSIYRMKCALSRNRKIKSVPSGWGGNRKSSSKNRAKESSQRGEKKSPNAREEGGKRKRNMASLVLLCV